MNHINTHTISQQDIFTLEPAADIERYAALLYNSFLESMPCESFRVVVEPGICQQSIDAENDEIKQRMSEIIFATEIPVSINVAVNRVAEWDGNTQGVAELRDAIEHAREVARELADDGRLLEVMTDLTSDVSYLCHDLLTKRSDYPVWAIDHIGDALVGELADTIVDADKLLADMLADELALTSDFDPGVLRQVIEGIEDNNKINGGGWRDWSYDPTEAFNIYADGECDEQSLLIVERAINSQGDSLKWDLPLVERVVYGQNFSGSFWDRSEA
jgi:hypothetical protein